MGYSGGAVLPGKADDERELHFIYSSPVAGTAIVYFICGEKITNWWGEIHPGYERDFQSYVAIKTGGCKIDFQSHEITIPEYPAEVPSEPTKGEKGRSNYSRQVRLRAVLDWEHLNTGLNPMTLSEFLEERFGLEGGYPRVANSTFYGWKYRLVDKGIIKKGSRSSK